MTLVLDDWLSLLEKRHPVAIDLGLERVKTVAQRLQLDVFNIPVITVAGTNGKGSTVATLESLALAHCLRIGCYTSPHLLQFNERIRIDGVNCNDNELCQAFAQIESVRDSVSLTYFEFTTLAALLLFKQQTLDVLVLEVGMGGRLDAVNIVTPTVSIITTVDFDHMAYLGDSLPAIAREKAGICRQAVPVILADEHKLDLLKGAVKPSGAIAYCSQNEYRWQVREDVFYYQGLHNESLVIPLPRLGPDLVAAALAAWQCAQLPWQRDVVSKAVATAQLIGRWQVLATSPQTVLDIGHNPQAAERLAGRALRQLQLRPGARLHLVTGMLADKDHKAALLPFAGHGCHWYLSSLPGARGYMANQLQHDFPMDEQSALRLFDDPVSAWQAALACAHANDLVLVWGSFLTVAAVLSAYLQTQPNV